VVADTLEHATAAAALVDIVYERDVVAVDMRGLPSEEPTKPKPQPGIPPQPDGSHRGDVDQALASAPVRFAATYTTPYEHHNPMEMHATTATWHGDRHLTVYDSTQGIFEVQRKLAASLGLPKENVRVISHFVGGGFGSKGSTWSHVVIAALAAKQVGRPVRLMLTRAQMFGPVGGRPATEQHLTLGATRDGTLTAIKHESRSTTSRFDEFVEHVGQPTRALYACPNYAGKEHIVRVDSGTPQFMRAPGESTGSFAMESAMDELAYQLAIDPIELRLRNYADKDPETGKPWSSKSLKQCYAAAAKEFGWSKRNPKPRSMRDGDELIGWGMATATYPAHMFPASAVATLRADGTALVRAGSQDIGTGTYTVMSQVAAETLGLPVDKVRFELGDTELPKSGTSGGSTTAASVGSAVKLACDGVKKKVAALAEGRDEPFAATLQRKGLASIEDKWESAQNQQRHDFATRSFGADFIEVRVDPELGRVRVSRVVAAFACGRILNAKTARSQYLGGIVWGLGMGLFEASRYDARTAKVTNDNFADYVIPVNADVPDIDVIFVDEKDEHVNEIGVKGVGEIGITGVAAALANAVYHATGKRIRDLPITLEKLL
ncbi:MAG TPA: xanthine dehydrogenase family protein molybdopterin-binding subunit, partial [Polyangia bacterium]|nr:xanthine dehydrogenase family protein molybdopterin-binding subunit [Polyangia bacterium]